MQRFQLPTACSLLGAFLFLLVAGSLAPRTANALGISVTGGTLRTKATDRYGGQLAPNVSAELPLSTSHSVMIPGEPSPIAYAQSSYEFSNIGIAVFNFAFEHSYSTWSGRSAESYGDVYFDLSEEARYEFDGSYTAGATDPNDILTVIVSLSSTGFSPQTFYEETDRLSPMGTAVLDGVPVGLGSSVTGSPTGVLAPGSYRLSYRYILYDNLDWNGSAWAAPVEEPEKHGFIFTLVPEPTTALLLAAGLAGLAAAGRRG